MIFFGPGSKTPSWHTASTSKSLSSKLEMETHLVSGKDTMLQQCFLVSSEERPEVRFFCPQTDEMGKTATDRKIPVWNAVVDHQIWPSDINHTELSVCHWFPRSPIQLPALDPALLDICSWEHSRCDTAHPTPFALGPDIQLHIFYILILGFGFLFGLVFLFGFFPPESTEEDEKNPMKNPFKVPSDTELFSMRDKEIKKAQEVCTHALG